MNVFDAERIGTNRMQGSPPLVAGAVPSRPRQPLAPAAAPPLTIGFPPPCSPRGYPFSDACLIAMDYGRESIVRDDWKEIFDDGELDKVITRMLHLDQIERTPA